MLLRLLRKHASNTATRSRKWIHASLVVFYQSRVLHCPLRALVTTNILRRQCGLSSQTSFADLGSCSRLRDVYFKVFSPPYPSQHRRATMDEYPPTYSGKFVETRKYDIANVLPPRPDRIEKATARV